MEEKKYSPREVAEVITSYVTLGPYWTNLQSGRPSRKPILANDLLKAIERVKGEVPIEVREIPLRNGSNLEAQLLAMEEAAKRYL